ncbi:MAG: Sir2 silent information regulator family NAD-dependent deacetylase [Ndongobacter sp.]|nr:Sir2 silent information regulator family NAD-dependent deacetylase [Ndongobacter sp.]
MFSKRPITGSTGTCSERIERLKQAFADAEAVVIGAGAGLSASTGFVYSGERFERYFADFAAKYRFTDMYSGGFYPYATRGEFWAYWSRYIWINRYTAAPKPVYSELFDLVRNRDYFVITTNVDHCFQKAGFDKKRLFYTQGDYGLFQCSEPCHSKTYENEDRIRAMVLAQGGKIGDDNGLIVPEGVMLKMTVPAELLPVCPVCGKPMTTNLRADDTFVEDEGWRRAAKRYRSFLRTRYGRVLFLELGVGYNTPSIIKYPFWSMTAENPKSIYACVNYGETVCPENILNRSVCVDGDIGEVIKALK